ncbi:MAG: SPFH domain-containing protein [Actinomycetota bacterium]|nr:SPFH domain-containing protein [Actinomycetota bacterium]
MALLTGFTRTSAGEIAVVRDGGPFDDNRVRSVVDPASSRTWSGMLSQVHRYPAQQRFYTITADAEKGDRPGVDVVRVPSSDGVEMGLEGTIYFTLNQDHATLREFDDKFGTRRFRGPDGESRAAYDGDDGWNGFLDAIVRPVIDNDLREQVNGLRCAELVSSCALVQNGSTGAPVVRGEASSNANIARVQAAINTSLREDLRRTLGGDYLSNIRLTLVRVTLPPQVQEAVNDAQAAFAAITRRRRHSSSRRGRRRPRTGSASSATGTARPARRSTS